MFVIPVVEWHVEIFALYTAQRAERDGAVAARCDMPGPCKQADVEEIPMGKGKSGDKAEPG